MRKLILILVLSLSVCILGVQTVVATAELGPKDVVYGDNYIVNENVNPITNDKDVIENTNEIEGAKGVGLLVVSICVATIYLSFTAFRVVRRAKKNEK